MPPQIHAHLYSRPSTAQPLSLVDVYGCSLTALRCNELEASSFPLSFEHAAEVIGRFDRMFVEMDGSFVWTGEQEKQAWQLDGMLYDRAGCLQRIELKGCCTPAAWQQLLQAFGWPDQTIVAQLIDLNCFVDADALSDIWSSRRHE